MEVRSNFISKDPSSGPVSHEVGNRGLQIIRAWEHSALKSVKAQVLNLAMRLNFDLFEVNVDSVANVIPMCGEPLQDAG